MLAKNSHDIADKAGFLSALCLCRREEDIVRGRKEHLSERMHTSQKGHNTSITAFGTLQAFHLCQPLLYDARLEGPRTAITEGV